MKQTTKQFILDKALTLFNENGVVNVRLQHIADSASLSVGNLAYHFKNKDAIILALYKRLKKKQELFLIECRILPLFEDIDFMMRNIFQIQKQYLFFYLDTLEVVRALPELLEKRRQLLAFQHQLIKFTMEFNTSRGSFIMPLYENHFTELTAHFCMTMDSWMSFQFKNGNTLPDEDAYCKELWLILKGLFTDMGIPEYRQLQHKRIV